MLTSKSTVLVYYWLLLLSCSITDLTHAAEKKKGAAGPPPFFIQDPTDSLCLAGEEGFKRCSIETLWYVLGEPGTFQIHKRAVDGTVDEMDDGMCLAKKSCKEGDLAKTMELKLAKCSHCGAKKWNILGDSSTGYVLTEDDGKTCLIRKKGTNKAFTAPCDEVTKEEREAAAAAAAAAEEGRAATEPPKLENTYTPFMLQFASASDISSMSSPGARLVGAASDGDKKAIQAMLKEGVDVNFRDWDQLTALIPCASSGNLDLAKFLVKEGIDVNAQDKDGISALMEASIMGHVKVVEFLLDSGAQVDAKSTSGVTALWLAASEGKTDVMNVLIKKGADATNTRSDGITALMTASASGHLDAIKLLLEHGADPMASDGDGVTALMNAAEAGSLEAVKILVEHKKGSDDFKDFVDSMSTTGFTALIIAAAQGHATVVDYLIDAGADPSAVHENKVTALIYAASSNHVDVMKVLLEKGKADIDAKHTNGGTALLEATTSGSVEAMKFLIERGAAFDLRDDDGVTPLMAVGSQKNETAQQVILDALKAKYSGQAFLDHMNLFSHSGGSAVMFAAAAGNAKLVKELIGLGAEVKSVAQATPEYLEKIKKAAAEGTTQSEEHVDGLTALHVAAQGGHIKTVEILLEQKVPVHVKDEKGRTPLILAIKGNYGEIASLLIRNGADPNEVYVDDSGVSHNLLFDAIMVENEKFAKDLIENGADIYFKDEKGVTTILQAAHRGLADIVQMLLAKHKANGKDGYIDESSDEGVTPLIAAASEGHLNVVKALLAGLVNIDAADQDGTNALMAAAARGHLEIVKELVAGGANINAQNSDGHTALMFAYNGKNQVETLWERYNQFAAEQEDPKADDGGTGPIIREALSNHTALVDLLIKSGADTKLKDKEGHTAKDFDYHPDTDAELIEKEAKAERIRDESRNEL